MTKNNLINKTDREFRAFRSFELKELRSEEGERQGLCLRGNRRCRRLGKFRSVHTAVQ